ncbi:MAG: nucleotidyltransferase family protein [Gammaproteobacteria bacterium]|nr:nucleotidyltransferase family protein [Gammaproteobacteria bacterium]
MKLGVSAILLAAGESQRMGPVNKLALLVDGVPLLQRMLQTLLQAQLSEVIVVLGHEQDRVRKLLDDMPVRTVFNERFRQGQMTSVVCGMQALQQSCEGVMVCLCDQALLEVADINRLVAHFLASPVPVLVPTYRGQRGNPIILAAQHCADILKAEANLGCKHFIENNPQLVTTLEFDNDHVVFDLDTFDDYAQLQLRLAGTTQVRNDVPAVRGA